MNSKIKRISTIILLGVIFIIALYLAIFAGFHDSGVVLFSKSFDLSNDTDSIILKALRYPRALKAIVAGSCLALSGLFMQAVSKNPLAEPYITGVSSGAGLGIVISILYFSSSNYSFFGFAGAFISSLLVISFAGLNRLSIAKLILTGLSVNLFVSSLISLFILTHAEKSQAMLFILSGGFSDAMSNKYLLIIFLIGLALSCFLIPKLNFLRLDSNMTTIFQKKKEVYTFLIIMMAAFLASLSVFAAGILGFVGIIAPQISKMLVGNDYRYLYFANILLGSSLILFADYISRVAIYPMQIPMGLVIALIGAPIFVYFLTKKGDIFDRD